MVKDARSRQKKHKVNTDPEQIRKILERIKEQQDERSAEGYAKEVRWEKKSKKVLDKEGVPTIRRQVYHIFSRQVGNVVERFSDETLIRRANHIRDDWDDRGLDRTILNKILKAHGVEIRAVEVAVWNGAVWA